VPDDPRRDERVRRLHQERPAAAEHQDGLAADAADRAVWGEDLVAQELAR